MPDYSKGKIYAIRSHQTEQIYIGSTVQTLAQRLGKHRCKYKQYSNTGKYNYVTSFDILKYDDHYIELLEMCPCTCRAELHRREGQLIREHNNCVNKHIAGQTQKEHYSENKERICARVRKYASENKEMIADKNREYYHNNKQKLCDYQKQHREKNREKLLEYDRKRNSKKTTCPCGTTFSSRQLKRHQKSKKHLTWLETQ